MTITDLQTDLDTNTDLLGFSASVEVANAGLSTQNIELAIVARAGYSWTQDASSNGVDFYLPEGLPQDQVLGSYQVANLAPGAQNSLIISNVCPAPKIIDSENFGYGWDIFVVFKGTYQDSVFLCSGAWPDVGGFNGPGGGVARVDPSGGGGSPFQLVSATINGPATVAANSTTHYSATVNLSNGRTSSSTNFISTVWSVSPASAFTINYDGVFSAGAVSANTVVTITADYFFAGTEYTITTDITVIAPPPRLVPVITWSNPGDIVYGMALSTMQLNANAASPANPSGAIPGTFTYSPPLGTVLAAGSHQALSVTFLPTDTTTYASSSAIVSLNVQQAPLTITANNQSTAYGAALPALSVSYSGFVNGDTSANLTTQPAVTTTATAGSPVGGYPITANGAADANYIINSLPGTLTVTPVPLTITANNQSKGYGAALPPLSASYSGFVNGDTPASLTTQPMVSTTATAGSPVGLYPITVSGATDANYLIS